MWDRRYREEGFAYGTAPNDFLVSSADLLLPASAVLCLAEGEGRNGVYLAQRGHAVTAVDLSAVGLEKAADLAQLHRVRLTTEQADLAEYQIPRHGYDGIISIFCHLPPAVRARLHRQVYPGLRAGGVFILEAYAQRQIEYGTGGPGNPDLLMNLDTIKRELEPLPLTHCVETKREIQEGRYHQGPGAVVQIIGIKESAPVGVTEQT